jgi:hypothetical protein
LKVTVHAVCYAFTALPPKIRSTDISGSIKEWGTPLDTMELYDFQELDDFEGISQFSRILCALPLGELEVISPVGFSTLRFTTDPSSALFVPPSATQDREIPD